MVRILKRKFVGGVLHDMTRLLNADIKNYREIGLASYQPVGGKFYVDESGTLQAEDKNLYQEYNYTLGEDGEFHYKG